MASGNVRITELPNDLTANIDSCDALGIVRLLRQSDAQLFAGWGAYPSLGEAIILQKMSNLADKAASLLKDRHQTTARHKFIFTGCGTSGRIAWLCSRALNKLLGHLGIAPCFHYLIAGGDEALIVGRELPEDDPPQGAADLREAAAGVEEVMLFGITCGLSAGYVAGQVDYAMHQPNYTTVLVGFNPLELARDTAIEKWHKTCKDTFLELGKLEMQQKQPGGRAVVLNPVVGPEPVKGSSRMKGGSATALLLNSIFVTALSRAFNLSLDAVLSRPVMPTGLTSHTGSGTHTSPAESEVEFGHALSAKCGEVATVIDAFAATYQAAYRPSAGIAALLNMAAKSLKHPDGHLYYLGADTLGIVGFIDSSEMVSTYGSSPHEVRGFIDDGWKTCHNQEGDLSDKGELYCIALSDFEQRILPGLTAHDSVILICPLHDQAPSILTLMDRVLSSPASCGLLAFTAESCCAPTTSLSSGVLDHRYSCSVCIKLPFYSALATEPVFAGFAAKLVLNAVSTGANVLKGKVFGNIMINLTVANDKLFFRSVSIVAELSGADQQMARSCLLKSIYREDTIDKYCELPVSSHILAATQRRMVVPIATLLAAGRCGTVEEAVKTLSGSVSLRVAVSQ